MSFTYFPASSALSSVSLVTLGEIHTIETAIVTTSLAGGRTVKVSGTTMTANDAGTPTTINFDLTNSIIQQTGYDMPNGTAIQFTTTGTLPYPLTPICTYYVIGIDANSYYIADSLTDVTLNVPLSLYGSVTGVTQVVQQSTGESYYDVLNGITTDPAKYDQVTDVVNHFTALSYNIQMVMDNTGVYWVISW